MPRFIRIDFSCLNEAGTLTGYAEMASGLEMELCCQVSGRGASFRVDQQARSIRIHRKTYPYRTMSFGSGNQFWASFQFTRAVGRALLRNLAASGHWTCDGGPVRICDWWESHLPKQGNN